MTPPRLVLLDDDLVWLRILRRALERAGCAVRAFSEPRELLDALAEDGPAIVVLDYMLAGTTGAEVARTIHARQLPFARMILLSGSVELVGSDERPLFDLVLDKASGTAAIVEQLRPMWTSRRPGKSGTALRAVRPNRKAR
ncbi:MAG: response regulator [Sandaracinaceae bacterium]|nr:response regulator [Sandaracinaceae bacterium]